MSILFIYIIIPFVKLVIKKSGSSQTFIIKRVKLPSKRRKDNRLAHPLDSARRQSRALWQGLLKARDR